eukprot:423869-Pleurochrysis_carterae.AAC.1
MMGGGTVWWKGAHGAASSLLTDNGCLRARAMYCHTLTICVIRRIGDRSGDVGIAWIACKACRSCCASKQRFALDPLAGRSSSTRSLVYE